MSWLVSSIANTLKLDDNNNNNNNNSDNDDNTSPSHSQNPNTTTTDEPQSLSPKRGVKEDLSELSQTLTRQFWGVASFLAPPPNPNPISENPSPNEVTEGPTAGIRGDISEITGKLRTGISKISTNKAVTEFTKIATNFLQFATEDGLTIEDYAERGVIGVTHQVVSFARDVSLHPETWLDFPLPDDDDNDDDNPQGFDLSDAQQEHALAVERLAPELAALRTELCLSYMSEASFWKIYFVLVHPRLSKEDALILSTPEIVKARAMLSQESNSRGKLRPYVSAPAENPEFAHEEHLSVPDSDQSESVPVEITAVEPSSSVEVDLEIVKHPVSSTVSTDIPVIEKTVVREAPVEQTDVEKQAISSSKTISLKDEDDTDDWLQEENTEAGANKVAASYPLGNDDDDDISFSDLEEDEDVPTSYNKASDSKSSAKESTDWIQLNNRAGSTKANADTQSTGSGKVSSSDLKNKESNDWLDFEDIDDA